jgi:hypothetical protein
MSAHDGHSFHRSLWTPGYSGVSMLSSFDMVFKFRGLGCLSGMAEAFVCDDTGRVVNMC